jgi:mannose-6-phosphate isomerase-like protein (cupin superfamily)
MSHIRNAATGENITFVRRSPELLIFTDRIEAGKMTPPPHLHPQQEERFTLLEGEFELQIAGVWHRLEPNQSLLVGKGVAHTFRIPSGTHATVQVEFSPALDTETVFRTMAKAGASGRMNPLYIGLIATQTKAGFHFGRLPEIIQRPLLHILAFFARVQHLSLETTKE